MRRASLREEGLVPVIVDVFLDGWSSVMVVCWVHMGDAGARLGVNVRKGWKRCGCGMYVLECGNGTGLMRVLFHLLPLKGFVGFDSSAFGSSLILWNLKSGLCFVPLLSRITSYPYS